MTIRSWLRPRLEKTVAFLMFGMATTTIFMFILIPACFFYIGAWWNEEPITFKDAIRKAAIL